MRRTNRLSALGVSKLTKPGRYPDGNGLYVQITAGAGEGVNRSWLFRYALDGRERQMGLGPCHIVTLAQAREKVVGLRRVLLDGRDPLQERAQKRSERRAAKATALTFQECAESFIAAHEATWRNPKHRAQWKATLTTYAFPTIGSLPVASVDTGLVLKIVEPIWQTKPETAGRLRGRVESILDWAKVRGYRQGENPARWRGHLDKLLPAKTKVRAVRHHPALSIAELPAFMATLREMTSVSAKCLEFVVLSAARTGEAVGAKWAEIDLKAKVWTVPPERMKSGREHRVPLSDRAVDILSSLPREDGSEYVFIGAKAKRPLSNMALLQLMRGMGFEAVPHGFRSTFRDWVGEMTTFPAEIAEAALAHVLKDKTQSAYERGDKFEKRRKLAEAWSRFCAKPPVADVIALGARHKLAR